MPNEFGELIWYNRPEKANGVVTTNFASQDGSKDITYMTGAIPQTYHDWATFENEGFDFEKPIFTYDPEAKAAYTSKILSDENGELFDGQGQPVVFTIIVTPSSPYSGSGFVIRTYNEDYQLIISIEDEKGFSTRTFEKTPDEYYPFPYSELEIVYFSFVKLEPYRFLKVISYDFGETRLLNDDMLVGEPTITNHFSLDNEEFELDTLDFTIFGNMRNFNITNGEKITYKYQSWEDGEFKDRVETYYVADATYNVDNTIDITAYDRTMLLDKPFPGIARFSSPGNKITSLAAEIINGAEIAEGDYEEYENEVCAGILSNDIDYREAARLFMLGTDLCFRKATWKFFQPTPRKAEVATFYDEEDRTGAWKNNIIGEPMIEKLERTTKIEFTRYSYYVNRADGRVQALYGNLDVSDTAQVVKFSQPFLGGSYKWYYVKSQDADGNDVLEEIKSSNSNFIKVRSGAYSATVINKGFSQVLLAVGFPYDNIPHTSEEQMYETEWFDNSSEVDMPITRGQFGTDIATLKTNYVWRKRHIYKVTFTSMLNVDTGRKVKINMRNSDDGEDEYEGWVITKTNHMDGLYEYEVLALWLG